jgi:hypothetical protein
MNVSTPCEVLIIICGGCFLLTGTIYTCKNAATIVDPTSYEENNSEDDNFNTITIER